MTRLRSTWGWGWAERFPLGPARLQLGKMAEALLGVRGLALREPVPDDAACLLDARLDASTLAAAAAEGVLLDTSRHARMTHAHGKSYLDQLRGFAGDYARAPDAVAFPASEAEVLAVLAWADAKGVSVVPFGGGTSVVEGVTGAPAAEGPFAREERAALARGDLRIALDLGRLRRVLEVDPVSRLARIEAGALGPDLEAQLATHGLTLRFFPQSFEFSTLGGWVATRAGGHFATLQTHIDDLVCETRMLAPQGIWQTRRLPASGAGPAADRLVIGSEGTLGVITEATVRVRPRPTFRTSATVRFADMAHAAAAARALAQSDLYPANCRVLDGREAALNRVLQDGAHALLVAFESADHPLDPWMARALELCADHGGSCPEGPKSRSGDAFAKSAERLPASQWRAAFLDGPYLQSTLIGLGVMADTFETACTWSAFPSLDAAIRSAVRDVLGAGATLTCRFTHVYPDGPAPYYTFVTPIAAGAELETWRAAKGAVSDAIFAHGGTITHHHGVGRVHRPWYERERPALFGAAWEAAKRAFDPRGIMNPGALSSSE